MRCITTGCLSLLLFAATANAAWLEADSDHFVIYGDQDEKAVRGFAERLEEAAQTITPLAYSPHPGEHTELARRRRARWRQGLRSPC